MRISTTLCCLALAGCGNIHPDMSYIEEMEFGQATAHNRAIQSQPPAGRFMDLSREFRLAVPDRVTFDFNSPRLDATARSVLQRQAAWIIAHPEARFGITGHADQIGSEDYNHALGQARAEAVLAFLVSSGIDRSRLELLMSQGDLVPLRDTGARERLNRRAVVKVSGIVDADPRLMHGDRAQVIYQAATTSAE